MKKKDNEAAEKLWMEEWKERVQLNAECTEHKVKQEAAWRQKTWSSVPDATIYRIKICASSKRWWNADIKERSMTVG